MHKSSPFPTFSLRCLFAIQLAVALLLGWFTKRALTQARAIAEIESSGGTVVSFPRNPDWLWEPAGRYYGYDVWAVEMPSGSVLREIPALRSLPNLHVLAVDVGPEQIDAAKDYVDLTPGDRRREAIVGAELPNIEVRLWNPRRYASAEMSRAVCRALISERPRPLLCPRAVGIRAAGLLALGGPVILFNRCLGFMAACLWWRVLRIRRPESVFRVACVVSGLVIVATGLFIVVPILVVVAVPLLALATTTLWMLVAVHRRGWP